MHSTRNNALTTRYGPPRRASVMHPRNHRCEPIDAKCAEWGEVFGLTKPIVFQVGSSIPSWVPDLTKVNLAAQHIRCINSA